MKTWMVCLFAVSSITCLYAEGVDNEGAEPVLVASPWVCPPRFDHFDRDERDVSWPGRRESSLYDELTE